MRFNSVLLALGSVAYVIGMLPGVDVRSSIDVVDENAGTATAYSIKTPRNMRFMPRTLDKSISSKTDGAYKLFENQWVTSLKVKSGDVVSVVDVTGCNALFFWNRNSIPSAFHIFCGAEGPDGKAASELLINSGVDPVSVYIASRNQKDYDTIKKAVLAAFPDLVDDTNEYDRNKHFTKKIYPLKDLESNHAYRFDARAGSAAVAMTTEYRVSKQPQ